MYGMDKFIGEWVNTSGQYVPTQLMELKERQGGNMPLIYQFESFGERFYITHPSSVQSIKELHEALQVADEKLLDTAAGLANQLYTYLYSLVLGEVGIMEMVRAAQNMALVRSNDAFDRGKASAQRGMRSALGIPERGGIRA